jgi:hypothetical protein
MKELLKKYFSVLRHHFAIANQGKEDLVIVLWVWGGGAYLLSFFLNKILLLTTFVFVKWVIAILVIAYFVWHIVIIKKCSPKKQALSKKEKEKLKKDRSRRFLRKLFLKEPITKWNPSVVATVIDVYVIVCFLDYFR